MSTPILIVLGILLVAIVLFVTEKLRVDLVAVLALVASVAFTRRSSPISISFRSDARTIRPSVPTRARTSGRRPRA